MNSTIRIKTVPIYCLSLAGITRLAISVNTPNRKYRLIATKTYSVMMNAITVMMFTVIVNIVHNMFCALGWLVYAVATKVITDTTMKTTQTRLISFIYS